MWHTPTGLYLPAKPVRDGRGAGGVHRHPRLRRRQERDRRGRLQGRKDGGPGAHRFPIAESDGRCLRRRAGKDGSERRLPGDGLGFGGSAADQEGPGRPRRLELFNTFWAGLDQFNPVGHVFMRGMGEAPGAAPGWPSSPRIEDLRQQWLDAPDIDAQKALAEGPAATGADRCAVCAPGPGVGGDGLPEQPDRRVERLRAVLECPEDVATPRFARTCLTVYWTSRRPAAHSTAPNDQIGVREPRAQDHDVFQPHEDHAHPGRLPAWACFWACRTCSRRRPRGCPWRTRPSGPRPARRQLPAAGGRHEGGDEGAAGQPGRRRAPGAAQRRRSSIRRSSRSPTRTGSCCACATPRKTDAAVAALQPLISQDASTGRPDMAIGSDPGRHDHADPVAAGAARRGRPARCEQSIEIVRRRIDETGVVDPQITRQGQSRIVVQLPGVGDPDRIKQLIGKTAHMTFRLVDETANANGGGPPPPGDDFLPMQDRPGREDRRAQAHRRRRRRPDRRPRRHQSRDRRLGGQLHLQLRRRAPLRRHQPRQCQPSVRDRAGRQGDLRAGDPGGDHRRPRPDQRRRSTRPRPTTSRCCCAPARCRRR